MHLVQDILIIILAGYMTVDQDGPVIMSWFPVIVGTITGLIMGDLATALQIAGTFQLMMLGVAALGGASAPNYGLATIIGSFVAIRTGTGIKSAIAIGIPIGLLAIQLEVIARIINNFLVHHLEILNKQSEWKKMERRAYLGPTLFFLQTAIPTALIVFSGPTIVNIILKVIPKWVTNGLTVAGGMLPVVGIAMLLHYMPIKKFIPYATIGFVLAAYMKVPVFSIALIGFAAGYIYFMKNNKTVTPSANTQNITDEAEGDDYDE